MTYSAKLRRLLQVLPFGLLFRVYSFVWSAILLRQHDGQRSALTIPDLGLSEELREAVEREGKALVEHRLAKMRRRANPIVAACLTKGPKAWERHFDKTGLEILTNRGTRGAIVIAPHLATALLVPGHLATMGQQVATLQAIGESASQVSTVLDMAMDPSTPRPLRISRADRWGVSRLMVIIRNGGIVILQPDSFLQHEFDPQVPPGPGMAQVTFLGLEVRVPTVIARLAEKAKDPLIVLALGSVDPLTSRGKIVYRQLAINETDEPRYMQRVYDEIGTAILHNIDQWTQWQFFPEF